jgi:PKD repeat protein
MSTYSVYNIKIDNELRFTPGVTAGYVLAINGDGTTEWVAPGGGGSSMDVDFLASTQLTEIGLTISFTNLSSPTPLHNYWEFGDNSFSTASNPDKKYFIDGTYSVKLNACDTISGGIETKTDYISIEPLFLLNAYPGATAAFSTRLLNDSYTGSCIRVRRTSDNTEQDIGFVNNNLDVAGLTAFSGSGSAFIRTWYDQSGSGNHVGNPTASQQPRIVNSGTVDTLEGKPCPFWINADSNVLFSSIKTFPQPFTIFNITKLTASSGIDSSVIYDSALGTGDRALLYHTGTTETPNNNLRYGASILKTIESSTADTRLITTLHHGTFSRARTEGVQRHSGATDNPGTQALTGLALGGLRGSLSAEFNFSGHIGEFIIYNSDQSSNFVGVESLINNWWSAF